MYAIKLIFFKFVNFTKLSTQASPPKDLDLPMQKADFRESAQQREASRDVGAQLFCALLRAVGVDARLVCSLQPLPLNGATKGMPMSPARPHAYMAVAQNDKATGSSIESDGENAMEKVRLGGAIGSFGGRNRFTSAPSLSSDQQFPQRPARHTPSK